MDSPTSWITQNPLRTWWSEHALHNVDHQEVVGRVQEDSGWNAHYAFMILMSAGIAVLGLLLSSPAVVIGAMLISPLMGPIVGAGFAIATFDSAEIRRSSWALAAGVLIAILFCALIVLVSPLQSVTDEIAARTRPNLFDLLVALFSGLAGSYAMIRGRQGAIVGVAIATSLMPPLATVGFGLATVNATVFLGSALLFFTNFMVIALSAAVMARLYGFGQSLSPRQSRLQAVLMMASFFALAVPLGLSLKQIAWETLATRASGEVVRAQFGEDTRVQGINIDHDARPIQVEAAVFTPEYRPGAERAAAAALTSRLGVPVRVTVDQLRVGTREAEASQLAAARSSAASRGEERIADRLALVAGVSPDAVLIDRASDRALVRAAPLPGASLATYRALEARIAASEPEWAVELIPPAMPPTAIKFEKGELAEAGQRAVAAVIWAAPRLRLPVGVSGSDGEVEALTRLLAAAKVPVRRVDGSEPALSWLAPSPQDQADR
jgi:uncharacterized hydrophobic protein (TIGR00271 family)